MTHQATAPEKAPINKAVVGGIFSPIDSALTAFYFLEPFLLRGSYFILIFLKKLNLIGMSEIQTFLFPGPPVLVRSHGRFLNICSSSRLVSHRPRSLNVMLQ